MLPSMQGTLLYSGTFAPQLGSYSMIFHCQTRVEQGPEGLSRFDNAVSCGRGAPFIGKVYADFSPAGFL